MPGDIELLKIFTSVGYGKSLIYQLTPFMTDEPMVTFIVTPLNSIMKDQVLKLSNRGIKACFVDMAMKHAHTFQHKDEDGNEDGEKDDSSDDETDIVESDVAMSDIIGGKIALVYCHPEALLSTPVGRKILTSKLLKAKVACIAIDEAHMILEW